MDQASSYRRTYKNKRLDEAYRLYVDGAASLRKLVRRSKLSLRTLQRHSSKDGWVEELEARKAAAAKAQAMAAQLAALTPDTAEDDAEAVQAGDIKAVMLGVMRRQQKFWDRVEAKVIEAFDDLEKRAAETRRALSVGQLVSLLTVAEKASSGVRKAYGIPDVSKIEWEDKTPAAQLHARRIRERQAVRMAAQKAGQEATGK